MDNSRRPYEQTALFRRRCLRCRHLFDVDSRYRFVCDLCHALDEWRDLSGALIEEGQQRQVPRAQTEE